MPTIARPVAAIMLCALGLLGAVGSAAAQSESPCVTQSECDFRTDQRDTAARRAEWARAVHNQETAHAAVLQAKADARARVAGNKEAKLEAILQRRREAYARGLR